MHRRIRQSSVGNPRATWSGGEARAPAPAPKSLRAYAAARGGGRERRGASYGGASARDTTITSVRTVVPIAVATVAQSDESVMATPSWRHVPIVPHWPRVQSPSFPLNAPDAPRTCSARMIDTIIAAFPCQAPPPPRAAGREPPTPSLARLPAVPPPSSPRRVDARGASPAAPPRAAAADEADRSSPAPLFATGARIFPPCTKRRVVAKGPKHQ